MANMEKGPLMQAYIKHLLKQTLMMKDPQSYVRSLAMTGSIVTVDKNIPVNRYFRSGSEMLRMAKMYADEGQLENAFILYTKYTTLFIEQIPKHPEYSLLSNVKKLETKQTLQSVFAKAEEVKAQLLSSYSKKYEVWKEQKEKEEAEEKLRHLQLMEEEEEQKKMKKIREEFDKEKNWRIAQGKEMLKNAEIKITDESSYPDSSSEKDIDLRSNSSSRLSSPSPSLYSELSVPSIDSRPPSTPSVDRSTKPRSLLSPGPDLAYVHGLRIVVVPSGLIDTFLNLAKENTSCNIETCGILAGKMTHNQLVITHLLVPKQSGTSDSCTTDNEEDIFLYQDKYSLITLGWIHTHPSQTAFMSSVDLHTHCSYQLMMPEAIAIVCSPKYDKTCIFSLTLDYGLDYISQCRQKGFHPHPNEPTIYEESVHVRMDNHATVTVVDLRK